MIWAACDGSDENPTTPLVPPIALDENLEISVPKTLSTPKYINKEGKKYCIVLRANHKYIQFLNSLTDITVRLSSKAKNISNGIINIIKDSKIAEADILLNGFKKICVIEIAK